MRSVPSAEVVGYTFSGDERNFKVDKIHLLKRITLELKEIQTLQTKLDIIQSDLGVACTNIT